VWELAAGMETFSGDRMSDGGLSATQWTESSEDAALSSLSTRMVTDAWKVNGSSIAPRSDGGPSQTKSPEVSLRTRNIDWTDSPSRGETAAPPGDVDVVEGESATEIAPFPAGDMTGSVPRTTQKIETENSVFQSGAKNVVTRTPMSNHSELQSTQRLDASYAISEDVQTTLERGGDAVIGDSDRVSTHAYKHNSAVHFSPSPKSSLSTMLRKSSVAATTAVGVADNDTAADVGRGHFLSRSQLSADFRKTALQSSVAWTTSTFGYADENTTAAPGGGELAYSVVFWCICFA